MGRKKIAIDEAKLFETCREGATVTQILGALGGAIDRETLRKRIQAYVFERKLVWAKLGGRGQAGILKTT